MAARLQATHKIRAATQSNEKKISHGKVSWQAR
jgi:hypothetical protein